MQIKKAKIIRVGDSYGITIPKAYIDNEMIDLEKHYDIDLKESKE